MLRLLDLRNVENISLGRDTNSSSSHSLIKTTEDLQDFIDERYSKYGNRERFNCITPKAKAQYITAALRDTEYDKSEYDYLLKDYKHGFELELNENDYADDKHWLLRMIDSLEYDKLKIEFLMTLTFNDSIGISGGSDENDEYIEFEREHEISENELTVKDMGSYFLLLDIRSGDKFRLRKYSKPNVELIPNFPELVDIKITNKCNHNCSFCYQNSSLSGKNCDTWNFKRFIEKLPKHTSLAIGGGEVWEHPDFISMLLYALDKDMLVNFTSKSVDFLKNKELISALDYKCDYDKRIGVGISISSIFELDKLDKIAKFKKEHYGIFDFYIHLIPEFMDMYFAEKLVKKLRKANCNINLLLLGYKDIGRAKPKVLKDKEEMKLIIEYLYKEGMSKKDKSYRDFFNVNIDTKLANDYLDMMNELFDKKTWYTEEGIYSMFFDCVENTIYKSSYQKEKGIELEYGSCLEEEFKKLKEIK